MTTDRPYRARAARRARPAGGSARAPGTQFDPRVVEVFLAQHAPALAGRAA